LIFLNALRKFNLIYQLDHLLPLLTSSSSIIMGSTWLLRDPSLMQTAFLVKGPGKEDSYSASY